jgi:RNA polymerase sigma-B factor
VSGPRAPVLLRAYREHGDLQARRRVIEQYLPLVKAVARRFTQRGEQLDDLVQVGSIGLINAVDRFRPERGVELGAFAAPTIIGEIKRHLRDRTWPVSVPREMRESRAVTSVVTGEEEPAPRPEGQQEGLTDAEDRAVLAAAFRMLEPNERRIVYLRFFNDLSQDAIGAELGLSQVQVSRALRRALEKLRGEIGSIDVEGPLTRGEASCSVEHVGKATNGGAP